MTKLNKFLLLTFFTYNLLSSSVAGFFGSGPGICRWFPSSRQCCERFPLTEACQKKFENPADRFIWSPDFTGKIEINGIDIDYVDIGSGEYTVIPLHGQPTQYYSWRHVMKNITGCHNSDFPAYPNACDGYEFDGLDNVRVVSLNYPGFGQSDKPRFQIDYGYTILEHTEILAGLIDALELTNVIFLTQDWGGGVALSYIAQYPENVAGFVCADCIYFGFPDSEFPPIFETFNLFRTDEGTSIIVDDRFFLEHQLLKTPDFADRIFPYNVINATIREYSDDEKMVYRSPFRNRKDLLSQVPLPRQIPLESDPGCLPPNQPFPTPKDLCSTEDPTRVGLPRELSITMRNGRDILHSSNRIQKLLVGATPGLLLTNDVINSIEFLTQNASTLTVVRDLAPGLHYVQEETGFRELFGGVVRNFVEDIVAMAA